MGHADASYVHMWYYAYVLIGHDVKCVSYTMTRGQGFYFCFLGFFWCSLSCDMGFLVVSYRIFPCYTQTL